MKKKEELNDFLLDDSFDESVEQVVPVIKESRLKTSVYSKLDTYNNEEPLVSCLRNEKVIVRFIPRPGKITNKRHLLYGKYSAA